MTADLVLDCSATMAWFFEGESSASTDALLDRLNQGAVAVVAQHWALEVANTLLMGERRKRCQPAEVAHFISILSHLSIEIDKDTASNAVSSTLSLAREHGLSAYDAAYLDLAMRRKVPIATLDTKLREAASRVGIQCLPEKL